MTGQIDDKLLQYAKHLKLEMDLIAMHARGELAYVVIDPISPKSTVYAFTDDGGRLFAQMHPSVIESLPKHDHPERSQALVWGIPVYKREQLPEGWGVPAL